MESFMTDAASRIQAFVDVWNAESSEHRLELAQEAFAPTATFQCEERYDAQAEEDEYQIGPTAIAEWIDGWRQAKPNEGVAELLHARPDGDDWTFSWRFVGKNDATRIGWGIAHIDDGGLSWATVSTGRSYRVFANAFQAIRSSTAIYVALFAAGLFAILYIPMSLFYRGFDMTPRDVGFEDYSVIWSIVMAALFISGVGVAGMAWFLFAFGFPIQVGKRIAQRLDSTRRQIPIVLLGRFAPLIAFLTIGLRGSSIRWLIAPLATALAVWAITAWITRRPDDVRIRRQEIRRVAYTLKHSWWSYSAVGVVIALTVAALFMPFAAYNDGRDVRENGAVPWGLWPWKAEPVDVLWTGTPAVALPDCHKLRYLGGNGGEVALFDWTTDTLYRMSAGSAVLQFRECPSSG